MAQAPVLCSSSPLSPLTSTYPPLTPAQSPLPPLLVQKSCAYSRVYPWLSLRHLCLSSTFCSYLFKVSVAHHLCLP
ncbi:hypothetical protein EJ02DRAFT_458763 [Clathrospora elynae]|uniref:Uncharacterized protein n=1 Tax=Clathrospora elynae TaxID=706981 RepID=A0A6A5SCW9_9PLEO|nr:hypothetical protein EJ02DRAFT_458763 [Clathrospora elynae]